MYWHPLQKSPRTPMYVCLIIIINLKNKNKIVAFEKQFKANVVSNCRNVRNVLLRSYITTSNNVRKLKTCRIGDVLPTVKTKANH